MARIFHPPAQLIIVSIPVVGLTAQPGEVAASKFTFVIQRLLATVPVLFIVALRWR